MRYTIALLLLTGCTVTDNGLRDFAQYHVASILFDQGREELKDEYKSSFMSHEEYREKKKNIGSLSCPKKFLFIHHLRINAKGRIKYRAGDRKSRGNRKERFITGLSLSPSTSNVEARIRIRQIRLECKYKFDNSWSMYIEWGWKF